MRCLFCNCIENREALPAWKRFQRSRLFVSAVSYSPLFTVMLLFNTMKNISVFLDPSYITDVVLLPVQIVVGVSDFIFLVIFFLQLWGLFEKGLGHYGITKLERGLFELQVLLLLQLLVATVCLGLLSILVFYVPFQTDAISCDALIRNWAWVGIWDFPFFL